MTSSTWPYALAACWTIALGLAGAKVTDKDVSKEELQKAVEALDEL